MTGRYLKTTSQNGGVGLVFRQCRCSMGPFSFHAGLGGSLGVDLLQRETSTLAH